MATGQFVMMIYSAIVNWTQLAIVVLIIVKILDFASGGRLFGGRVGGGGGGGGGRGPRPPRERRERTYHPYRVIGFNGAHHGHEIHLWWDANPAGDNVAYYELERRKLGRRLGGWRRLGSDRNHHDAANPYRDPVPLDQGFAYRIRAVNSRGRSGWEEREVPWAGGVITVNITQPLHNTPHPDATRLEGDANPIIISGSITGTTAPNYDNIWGIYNAADNLVVAAPPYQSLPSGTASTPYNLNCAAAGLHTGRYRIFLFAQLPGTGPTTPPARCVGPPPSLIASVMREIEIMPERIILTPNTDSLNHNAELQPPFGRNTPYITRIMWMNQVAGFDVRNCTLVGNRAFHVFFYCRATDRILDAAQLDIEYGIRNIRVEFDGSGPTGPIPYINNFYHDYNPLNANITIKYNTPALPAPPTRPRPFAVEVYVTAQNNRFAPPDQHNLDNEMINLAAPNIAVLRPSGVLDFNMSDIIYIL